MGEEITKNLQMGRPMWVSGTMQKTSHLDLVERAGTPFHCAGGDTFALCSVKCP